MRTIFGKLFVIALFFTGAISFTGCSTVDDGDYAAPITLTEKIGGKWVVNSVTQTDETNAKTKTLTNLLDFNTFVINLSRDAQGNASAFSVEGKAPELLPLSGTWHMENEFTNSNGSASRIFLNDGSKDTKLTVTTVPGNTKILEFKLTRNTSGQPYVSYTYNLMLSVE